MRLAGGLSWFSAVEILSEASMRPVPVEGIEAALGELPAAARTAWERLTAPRPPLTLGERVIRLDQPQVAGIVNVTPDSFSGDGRIEDPRPRCRPAMAAAGAALIDVGGESTRPGAKPVWRATRSRGWSR